MERLLSKRKQILSALLIILSQAVLSQQTVIIDSSKAGVRTVIAGKEYQAGGLKKFLWGADWRKEWTTPVTVRILNLDTAFGGLKPLELGGGRQTKSLHMTDPQGRRWVLRSVNKTYTKALPEIARCTIVEKIMNDQIATNHPFAALAVPPMASAAGVYHTNPKLYLVPYTKSLGQYNSIFGNTLILLEERPDKTQIKQKSFGYPKDIDGSDKMVENLTEDNDVKMDQHHYVKTRLFDIFLGDWGRHIDNWRWAEFDSGKREVYRPVPKDRDQAWAKFQGLMMGVLKAVAGLGELQSFSGKIKDITSYNQPAVEIDRRFTNEITKQEWIDSAKALQHYLTDAVIEKGIRQLPTEAFAISGNEIINNLKQRRNDLAQYAADYYDFLSFEVDIPGSKKNEYFHVKRLNDKETNVSIYKINKEGKVNNKPLYSRTFLTGETKEVRLYGLDGNDVYHLDGNTKDGILVTIIAGPGRDSLNDLSTVNGRTHRTKFYDNPGTAVRGSTETKIRLSDTTYLYPFEEDYQYDYSGVSFSPGLSPYYRLFVGVGYKKRTYGWKEKPYKSDYILGINYSLAEKTIHPYFVATYPEMFSRINFHWQLGYDGSRRFNYLGTGNETIKLQANDPYYFLRTENFYAETGVDKFFGDHNIGLNLNYDGVRVSDRSGDFLKQELVNLNKDVLDWKHFATAALTYTFSHLNDKIVPTAGIHFSTTASYTKNLEESRSFNRYAGNLGLYIPLFRPFSLFINTGGAALDGEPEFFQLNNIGGNITMRGYIRNRFYGRTVFYDQNEFRWIPNFRSYLFNGKVGLIALYDLGRVWNPGEVSDTWHYGYGGGLMLVPFNKISATIYYSVSKEDKVVNLRVGKFF